MPAGPAPTTTTVRATARGHDGQLLLACRRGVHGAADRRAVGADRVALGQAEAHPDLLHPALLSLARELGIGDQRPHHADHVGDAVGEQALGDRCVGDAAGHEHRHVDHGLHGRRRGGVERRLAVPRADVRGLRPVAEAGVVPAADADVGHIGTEQAGDLGQLRHGDAATLPVAVDPDADADREVGADEGASGGQHLADEPHPVLAVPPQRSSRRLAYGDRNWLTR